MEWQRFTDLLQAARVAVECQQIEPAKFQKVRSLATGRSAGIQHTHAGTAIKQGRGPLRPHVLNRDPALMKMRQFRNRNRMFQQQG